MRNIAVVVLLVICSTATVQARGQPTKLLLQAVQCLAAKNFLPSPRASSTEYGYYLDEKSYPGQKVLYVVEYAARSYENGWVYQAFITERDGHRVFNIQNNATFVMSRSDPSGVTFTGSPLGGVWTHKHLALAIKEIEESPRFTIPEIDLSPVSKSIICEAYTDPDQNNK